MQHPDTAMVTGAFSYTGRYVARRLLDEGVGVRTLTRSPEREGPFGGLVPAAPLDFSDPDGLFRSMQGAGVLYNTYWVRFGRERTTFDQAVENSRVLFDAAAKAGVGRIVHFSVANASSECRLPYFRGKGQVEEILQDMGIPFAIIRPTLVFGQGDLLLNNMAWALRRFPVFPVFGRGDYQVQPIYAEDLAAQAVAAGFAEGEFRRRCRRAGDLLIRGIASLAGLGGGRPRPVGAYSGVAGIRPDPAGRPRATGRGAEPRRDGRSHGRAAHIRRTHDRHDQAGRLAQRQLGWPGPPVRVRTAAQLQAVAGGAVSAQGPR